MPESPIKQDIAGYVRLPNGKPLTFVPVRLQKENGSLVAQTWTSTGGRFEFQQISCGYYVVAVDVAGFLPVRIPVEHSYLPLPAELMVSLQPASVGEPGAAPVGSESLAVPPKAWQEYQKGLQALAKGNEDQALRHFNAAVGVFPVFGQAYVQLAHLHLQRGATGEAEQAAEKAIELNPRNAAAHALLGSVRRKQNQSQRAIEALQHSLRLQESSWFAHLELAHALLSQKRSDEAQSHFERAHELNRAIPFTHIALYNALVLREDYQGALAELDEFLKLFPNHPSAARGRQQREALRARAKTP